MAETQTNVIMRCSVINLIDRAAHSTVFNRMDIQAVILLLLRVILTSCFFADPRTRLGIIMDHRLLEIIACPVCNGKLYFNKENQELVCKADRLGYPLRDGIPVLLENEARQLPVDEK